jgi:hypothetical protein
VIRFRLAVVVWVAAVVLVVLRQAGAQEIHDKELGPLPTPVYEAAQPELLRPAPDELRMAARQSLGAIVLVGHPQYARGTAFVISKKHRLLATNAHVADILAVMGTMTALVNGQASPCTVDRVWYHPGIVRKHDNCLAIQCQDPLDGPVMPPCADVAVLHLADGPELPAELPLATPEEIRDLFAQRVGVLGFPAYPSPRWPAAGEVPRPTFRSGSVSRLASFSDDEHCPPQQCQKVQHDMGTWSGFSGSPIFLANGHVVAIDTFLTVAASKDNTKPNLDFGVRVDCLWELFCHHHHLAGKVNCAVDPAALDLGRYQTADPKQADLHTAIRLVHECDRLMLDGQYVLAAEYCNQALHLAPAYSKAYQVHGEVLNEFVAVNRARLTGPQQRQQLQWALDDSKRYLAMSLDPAGVLDVYMRSIWLQSVTRGTLHDREAASAMTKLLDGELLTPQQRAYAHRIRAASTGYHDLALADLNEAIRLAPRGTSVGSRR